MKDESRSTKAYYRMCVYNSWAFYAKLGDKLKYDNTMLFVPTVLIAKKLG